jgi:PrtD family type I secretion system ABC transporter
MGLEPVYRERWGAEYESSGVPQLLASDRASVLIAVSRMLRLFLQSASLALGAALAISGLVSTGTIVAGSIIMARGLAPIDQVTAQWNLLQGARRAWARLTAALSESPPAQEAMELPAPKGHFETENLVVAAPGAAKPILTGVSFRLRPGDGLGVVGPTGSGKSTLARALVGVWPAMSGDIRLDGARLDQWPRGQLGAAIGYVPQAVEIFSGSIQDNIARFAANPDPRAVVRAAKRANVHEMILRLSQGYATELGAGGVPLSAGQRQRLALARALYGNPVLLVLDEPNSNLDVEGEAALTAALAELRREGVTVVLVAHRHRSLQSVDQLLFLREGRQAAFGPREEVLKRVWPELYQEASAQSPGQAPVMLAKLRAEGSAEKRTKGSG